MPEGPEIKRTADEIARAIAHQTAIEIYFAFDTLQPFVPKLQNRIITTVQPRGKALLIRFDNGLSIYSHNQLYGKWIIRDPYAYPETNRQLRLAIHTARKSALLYSASEIAVLDDAAIAVHPFLSKLGPDVLDESTTVAQVIQQFQAPKFYRRSLPSLLLDQRFLCGLGNYLRSEVLFVAKVFPPLRPVDCSTAQIGALAMGAIAVARQSYRTKGITNDLRIAEQLKRQGKRRRDYRHYVFGREGQPCFVCGTPIVKTELSGRRLYYCPNCQRRI
jgi:endonuclease-8